MVQVLCVVYQQEKLIIVQKRADVVKSCLVESNEEGRENLESSKGQKTSQSKQPATFF